MEAAILEKVNRAAEIVVEQLLGAGFSVHSCEHTGIGGAVDHPIGRRENRHIVGVPDVANTDINSKGPQRFDICFAAAPTQVVDAGDRQIGSMFKKVPGDDTSREAADSGDENFHDSPKIIDSVLNSRFPRFHDLTDRLFKGNRNVPSWIVGAHFAQVAEVTDVVADAVFVEIGELLRLTGKTFRDFESFEDRAGIGLAASEVADSLEVNDELFVSRNGR